MKLVLVSGGIVILGREKYSWRFVGVVIRFWFFCSFVIKNDIRRAIRCGFIEIICLLLYFRINYLEL